MPVSSAIIVWYSKIVRRVPSLPPPPLGVVESVKAVSDLFAPVSGEVVEVNADLAKKPETVNSDPYGQGWMIVVKLSSPKDMDALMSAADYEKLIAGAGH